jgi:hypothetical protein
MPHEIQPTGPLLTLLKTFSEVGGRLDYVLIGGLSPSQFASVYALHKAAAAFTIESSTMRYPRSKVKGPDSRREPEKAQGTALSPIDFFAPSYPGVPFKNIITITREEREQCIRDYYYAFNYPPYYPPYNLLCLDECTEEKLFPAINHELFGDDMEALTIYSWSTDWADYFHDGHQWWGSFLWTVQSTHTKMFVGIAASAS